MPLKTKILSACFLGLSCLSIPVSAVTDTYSYTGAAQAFVVPAGVSSVTIEVWGAAGGGHAPSSSTGGMGGYATGTLAVTAGDTLNIYVGGQGAEGNGQSCNLPGGFNGGGATGTVCCSNAGGGAGSGGGASDVRHNGTTLNDRVIVAGGGAGGGSGETGASGGGLSGGDGGSYSGITATGGSQIAGGTAGGHFSSHACSAGTDGGFGFGGIGDGNDGGGSGGGWYGGGGGPNNGGGGAGSSYIAGTGLSAGSTTPGLRSGDGEVQISYTLAAATYTVGGTLTGLPGGSITLQNNLSSDLVLSANGAFAFPDQLPAGASYSVTVSGQPSGQVCTVTNGTGTVSSTNVTDVDVACTAIAPVAVTPVPTISVYGLVLTALGLVLVAIRRLGVPSRQ